ncbi:hypothetical protein ABW99_10290 [Pandoraea thiooxydans]|uniref:DUF2818 domain-containing protein n=1 Tax=Pandoraea thiooxydans TaxID=445709 RepID=A0A0G3ENA2_9BURK|nr:DUF2818 family protein [Pandoraea thiooxydans]AKJ68543.1 hypothetical protein ABW99_10290 [Pandoraea thiooxydans]
MVPEDHSPHADLLNTGASVSLSAGGWLVILLALVGANLPFLNQRLFALIPLGGITKSPWLRLLELIVVYFVVGLLAWVIEARIGNVFHQGWQFYAVTASMFLVLAFPGFVYRYLWRHR